MPSRSQPLLSLATFLYPLIRRLSSTAASTPKDWVKYKHGQRRKIYCVRYLPSRNAQKSLTQAEVLLRASTRAIQYQ